MQKRKRMYHIESEDVNRFSKILDQLQHKYNWDGMYANVLSQISKEEFEIQKWWADRVNLIDKNVAIFNGGLGYFSVPFAHEKGAKRIDLYDMDPVTEELSWYINANYKPNFCHHLRNVIFEKKFIERADVYINTSCEHSYDMKNIIPKDKLCVMSGNNLSVRGHINMFKNAKALRKSVGFSKILFEETKIFQCHDERGKREYEQFLIIGVKG